jgi:hypothetical protein
VQLLMHDHLDFLKQSTLIQACYQRPNLCRTENFKA